MGSFFRSFFRLEMRSSPEMRVRGGGVIFVGDEVISGDDQGGVIILPWDDTFSPQKTLVRFVLTSRAAFSKQITVCQLCFDLAGRFFVK